MSCAFALIITAGCLTARDPKKVPGHPFSSIRKQIAFSHATGRMRTNFATKGSKKALVTTSCSLTLPSNICEKEKIRLEINFHSLLHEVLWFPLQRLTLRSLTKLQLILVVSIGDSKNVRI